MILDVVVVEDEKWVRRAIIDEIPWSGLGMRLIGEAESGPEALRLCVRTNPDIVISDIRIPGFDGLDFIARLQTEIDTPPVVVLVSGYSDFAKAQQAIRLGVLDYLLKPVKSRDIELVLRSARERIEKTSHSRHRLEKLERKVQSLSTALRDVRSDAEPPARDGSFDSRIDRALELLREEFASPLNMRDFAARVGMSRSSFASHFKEEIGMTFVDYVTKLRMEKAKILLSHPSLSISDIAVTVGYGDANYFSRLFKAFYSFSPSEYRETHH